MPITDYKITDIERDAVSVEKQRPDVMDPDADITKAWFDTYPDKIRAEHDSLIDYLGTMSTSFASSAAAATANKGSMTGFVPLGAIVELSMINGNTSANPTLSIDGVTHTITGMPTVAQVQANSVQIYRLVKTGASALTYTYIPDYVTEYGTRVSGYKYKIYASGVGNIDGNTYTPTITAASGTITTSSATASYIKIGRKVFVELNIIITTAGTGIGYLIATLPFQASNNIGCAGVETNYVLAIMASITAGESVIRISKYDATTIIGNTKDVRISFAYTTA